MKNQLTVAIISLAILPTELRLQAENICVREGRNINYMHLVPTEDNNLFALYEGNTDTCYNWFVAENEID